jgi:hypothetical protein
MHWGGGGGRIGNIIIYFNLFSRCLVWITDSYQYLFFSDQVLGNAIACTHISRIFYVPHTFEKGHHVMLELELLEFKKNTDHMCLFLVMLKPHSLDLSRHTSKMKTVLIVAVFMYILITFILLRGDQSIITSGLNLYWPSGLCIFFCRNILSIILFISCNASCARVCFLWTHVKVLYS